MSAKLKLVSNNKVIVGKRPVQTFYYGTGPIKAPSWALKTAHSTTPDRAVKACVRRMIDEKDLKGADVYDVTQALKYKVRRAGGTITISKVGR